MEVPNVSELIKETYNGTIVLPEFQRSFIWEPDDVRELLVSVLGDYFIGSMLLLDNLKDDSPFALRLVEGVGEVNKNAKMQSIVKILLDGQQRTSALFYALYEPDLPLKNRKSSYKFYLDFDKALKKEWDSAVIAVSTRDKKRFNEIKTNENNIPFSYLRDIEKIVEKFGNRPASDLKEKIKLANDFMNRRIHTVSLPKETSLEKIVDTFERINRTGEPLSIFELLTARLYKEKIKLRDLLDDTKEDYTFIEATSPEFILKVIALLRAKEPKRKNILELEAKNFVEDWERACNALEVAYKRTIDIKNGYGVLDFKKWMPYSTMLYPLAAMVDFIKIEKLEAMGNYEKIDRWYWAAVFSNRYDQSADSLSAVDFKSIKDWICNDTIVPDFMQKFNPETVDLDTDKSSSAIYRGVISMIVLAGALDFKTGQAPQFDKEKIQDDHIFPKSVYKEHRIVNRTLISTNTSKGSKIPSEYFKNRLDELGEDELKRILNSHLIPEDALTCLLKDELNNFMEKRKYAIIKELKVRLKLS